MQPFWMCCIKSDVTLKLHGGNVSSTFASRETVLLLDLYQVLNSETFLSFVKRFTDTKTLLWFTAPLGNCCYTLTSHGHFNHHTSKVLFLPSVCICDVTVTQKPGPAHQ